MDIQDIKEKAFEYIQLENDNEFKSQVENLLASEDFSSLSDRFYCDLEFGTGGLRGIIGGGYNRMNPFVVKRATQGLANYVIKNSSRSNKTAVIAYDSRNYSLLFAKEASLVFAANGIKTYLFSTIHPTPILSFAVRKLHASVGIVVTASHNPPEYNGYKVYWDDGAQVVAPHDKGIIAEVKNISTAIRTLSENEAISKGLLVYIDKEIDEPYFELLTNQIQRNTLVKEQGKELKIVYTPLHGTGTFFMEKIFSDLGISLITVPEQREPNGNFPTVKYPNPEEGEALKLAIDLGLNIKADFIMGTDPDSDRLGIAVRDGNEMVLITGNQLGALLSDYIFSTLNETHRMPTKPAFIKTIVTTDLQRQIAETYGVTCFDVLTGFKYIASMIRSFENSPSKYTYLFGGEESYGYLFNTEVRDKDAISAAVLTAEMAIYLHSKGKTILDHLYELFFRHGWYKETLLSKGFKGEQGLKLMKALMDNFRSMPPHLLGGEEVLKIKDYLDGTITSFSHGSLSKSQGINLPSSNVLQFILSNGSIVSVRPSGTEPKVKFYISCHTRPRLKKSEADFVLDEMTKKLITDIEVYF